MKIALERLEHGTPLVGTLRPFRPLFLLAASRGGTPLAMSHEPAEGALVYACLHRTWRGVRITVLHPALVVSAGRQGVLRSGDLLKVGQVGFRVNCRWRGRRPSRHRSVAVLAGALCIGLAGIAIVGGGRSVFLRPRAAPEAPSIAVAAEPTSAIFVEEARRHLREGDRVQARLTLIEGRRHFPESAALSDLLDAVEREEEGRCEGASDAGRLGRAREAFEEGVRSMERGDLVAAERVFERARAFLQGRPPPPFAQALDRSWREVRLALDTLSTQQLSIFRTQYSSTTGVRPLVALLSSVEAFAARRDDARIEAFRGELSRHLRLRAQQRLRAADERWRLEGCDVARPLFAMLIDVLGDRVPSVTNAVRHRLTTCARGGGG